MGEGGGFPRLSHQTHIFVLYILFDKIYIQRYDVSRLIREENDHDV